MGFNYLFIFPPSYFALSNSKARHKPTRETVSWCLETSLFLRLPSLDGTPSLPLLSLFLSFIFFPTSFRRVGLLFWVPDVLCRHSEVVLWNLLDFLNALLMNLWGRNCSPRPTPPPSWLLPSTLFSKRNWNHSSC